MALFRHHDLRLLNPSYDSPLVDLVTELEHLRRLQLAVTTPPALFAQLRDVFHWLESLASARIEGNHTTLSDYVESKLAGDAQSDTLRELDNIETAMRAVEEQAAVDRPLSEHFLRHLHALTVDGLQREGDRTPGAYRAGPVSIGGAEHRPPDALEIGPYMRELLDFCNAPHAPKYHLMKVALAHHRFAWIHPFGNGNGRVVRLLTHALLIQYGFQVTAAGRLLNPAAIFCADRERYYALLAAADSGTPAALEAWCMYVLAGIRDELQKVHRLADYGYLRDRILVPAIDHARSRHALTPQEEALLRLTARAGTVKTGDLAPAMPSLSAAQRTYQVRKLVEQGLLRPVEPRARQYTLGFLHNALLRGVMRALEETGFVPPAVAAPAPYRG